MNLKGTHTLNAPVEKVWEMMMDPNILAKVTPGITSLEPLGSDKYKAIAEIKLGPVSGSFTGNMEVVNKVAPESFTLMMKQNSKIGNVSAQGNIKLIPLNISQTEVAFDGKAKLSGTLARTGQRVLSGVANTMTAQFFNSLETEINTAVGIQTEKASLWARIAQWFRDLFGGGNKDA